MRTPQHELVPEPLDRSIGVSTYPLTATIGVHWKPSRITSHKRLESLCKQWGDGDNASYLSNVSAQKSGGGIYALFHEPKGHGSH